MPLLIVDGPEAAGKTTLIASILDLWPDHARSRKWGPVGSWEEYVDPLVADCTELAAHPGHLITWDRSWASEWVYSRLLSRPTDFTLQAARILEDNVALVANHRLILTSTQPDLVARRAFRLAAGHADDHPVSTTREITEFTKYGRSFRWTVAAAVTPSGLYGTLRALIEPASDPVRLSSQSYEARR